MKFNGHTNYIFRCIIYFQKTLRYLCFLFVFLLWHGCSQDSKEQEKELLKEYNVTFLSDLGNVFTSVKITKGNTSDRTLSQPSPDPIKGGFVFDGWYADPLRVRKFYFNSKRISSDLKLYAKWRRIRYAINFMTFGGNDISPIEVEGKSIADIPNNPEKEFSIFDNWYIDKSLTIPFNKNLPVLRDLTLYAKWKTRTYNFVFYSNGGSSIDTQTIPSGGKVEKPKDPVKEGFAFLGWFRSLDNYSLKFDFENTKIISRLWVYAKWTKRKISISYNAIDGYFLLKDGSEKNSISERKLAGTKATYRVPRRGKRFQFVAWYTDSNFQKIYDFSTLQEDIKLYAKWESRKFKIVFKNLNGVKKIPTQNIIYNKKAQRPDPDPVKLNSKFIGWYTSLSFNQKYDFKNTAILEDKNIYAYFLVEWDITFNLLGGTIKDSPDPVLLPFTQGSSIIPPKNPIKEGYTFVGWTRDNVTNSTLYDFTLLVNNNITLYAKWASSVAVIKSISLFKSSNPNANFEKDVYIASSQRKKIRLTAPNIDLKRIVPSFIYSGVYSSTPSLDAPQDFSKSPVIYQLTAEDKSITEFNVSVSNSANTEKQIFLFQINANENSNISNTIVGNIIQNQKIIGIILPSAVNAESLQVYIETSYGATVTPSSGSVINLNKLSYLVTAEDKSSQAYTLDIQRVKSTDKDIKSFTFVRSKNKTQNGDDAIAPGKITSLINGSNISVTLPSGSVLTNLSPTISSTGIRIDPDPDKKQDFSNSLVYKVIAENSSTKDYTVSVSSMLSSNNKILEFAFRREDNPTLSQDYEGTVNSNAISISLPEGIISRGPLTPYIRTENYVKSISPQGPRSFGNRNLYKVLAQDMSERIYILTITEKKSSIKDIISFVFDIKDNKTLPKTYKGQIRGDKVYIETMPFGTNVSNLKPTISILGGGTISPASIRQNFSNPQNPVTYTVTARDGSTKVYTVLLKIKSNPSKQIISFVLERRSNSQLSKDVIGRIDGDNIILVIRQNLLPLIGVFPKIVHNGQSISPKVTTAINLDKGVMTPYTVSSSNKSTQIYKVKVIPYGEDIAMIDAFWLDKKFNSSLENTISAVIDQESASIIIDNAPSMLLKPDSQGNITVIPSMIIRGKNVTPEVETPAILLSSGHLVFKVFSFNNNVSKSYALTINSQKSSEKILSSFSFDINKNSNLTSSVKGVINEKESNIMINVPFGTDTSNLLPSLEITGVSYEPIDAQDFGTKENPQKVEYIIYAKNGSKKSYFIDLRFLPNTQAKILSFVFSPKDNRSLSGTVSGTIKSLDSDTPTISLMLPPRTLKKNLIPKISISKKAFISPSSSSQRDFSNKIQYTITSEDKSSVKTYTIAVSLADSDSKNIISFNLYPEDNPKNIEKTVVGQVSGKKIELTVPFGTQIQGLLPRINTSGTSYTPTGKISFSTENGEIQPLIYTVVAEDKSKKVYKVNIRISDPVKYTISFSGDNVSEMKPIVISKGEFLPNDTLPPSREGYFFSAWYKSDTNFNNPSYIVNNNTLIEGNLTLYPKWTIKAYTVTFISQGVKFNKVSLNFDDILNSPSADPNKNNYTFVGWFEDQTATTFLYTNFGKIIKRNLTLYAGFSQDVFVISFISGDVTYTANIRKGSLYSVPSEIPNRDESSIIGWYEDQAHSIPFDITSTTVESEKTLYAKWGSDINTITNILISTTTGVNITPTVSPQENTITATVDSEYISTLKLSYSLPDGARASIASESQINLDSNKSDIVITSESGVPRTYNISITPRYTITFDYSKYPTLPGGTTTPNKTKKINAGETISFPPEISNPNGYIFEGWFDELGDNRYVDTYKPSENITLYAKWEKQFYTVTFRSGGKTFTTQKKSRGDTNNFATKPNPSPTKGDAIFSEWYENPSFENDADTFKFKTTAIKKDITLYARWKYKVTFNSKSVKVRDIDTYEGKPVSDPSLYVGDSNFSGWYTTSGFIGNTYDFETHIIKTHTFLYAKWNYKITFNPNNGSNATDVYVTYKNLVSEPDPKPKKDKHDLGGWYTTNTQNTQKTKFNFLTDEVTSDLTLYAKWESDINTITNILISTTTGVNITPTVSPQKNTITATVDSEYISSLKLSYLLPDGATASIASGSQINLDSNKSDIVITSESGVPRTYNISITPRYTITFDYSKYPTLPGGTTTPNKTKKINAGETISFPDKIPDSPQGYLFEGWFDELGDNRYVDNTYKPSENITLYAKWEKEFYTVTFNLQGNTTNVQSQKIERGGSASSPNNVPKKDGSRFYWSTYDQRYAKVYDFNTVVSSSITIYGIYIKEFTVTLHYNDGTTPDYSKKMDIDTVFSKPISPSREGYTFEDWYTTSTFSGTPYNFNTKVTSDLTLYAKWNYKITFNPNNGSNATDVYVTYKNHVSEPDPKPKKDKHVFNGWYTTANFTGTPYNFKTKVTSDLTLYAKFVELYTVKFQMNQGTPIVKDTLVASGGKVKKPDNTPRKTGYTFVAWYTERSFTNSFDLLVDTVTSDLTLYAKWKINTYTVSFNVNNGTPPTINAVSVDYNTSVTIKQKPQNPTKTGYTFVAWYTESSFTNSFDLLVNTVTSDLTLYAKWKINTYTVSFNHNNGTKTSVNIEYNKTINNKPNPTKKGYTFVAWYTESSFTNSFDLLVDTVTSDLTLYAKWESDINTITNILISTTTGVNITPTVSPQKNTITATVDSEYISSLKLSYLLPDGATASIASGSQINLDSNKSDIVITSESGVSRTYNISITPRYTITFDYSKYSTLPGGTTTPNKTKKINAGETISISFPPEISNPNGYIFKGWFFDNLGNNPCDKNYKASENITLYANWEKEFYTVTFISGGKTFTTQKKLQNNTNYFATKPNPNPTKGDAIFSEWYEDASFKNDADTFKFKTTAIKKDITLYARWKYKVTFNSKSVKVKDIDTYEGKPVSDPSLYVGDSNFSGWYTTSGFIGNTYDFETHIIKTHTFLYAKWNYKITFNPNNGSNATDVYVTYKNHVSEPDPKPEKDKHDLGGWYKEKALTNAFNFLTDEVTSDLTLYAKFVELYTVKFQMNQGTPIVKDALVASGGKVKKPDNTPRKTGYTFVAWYTESSFTNSFDLLVDTVTSDLTLYAKWKAIKYTITFKSIINGSQTSSSIEIIPADNNPYMKRPDPTSTGIAGKAFLGWFKSSENLPFDFEGTPITESFTLTARWEDASNYTFVDYDSNRKSITITHINESLNAEVLIVPININQKIVKKIAATSANSIFNTTPVNTEMVVLPHNMVGISSYAFSNFKKLETIKIPDNVTSIGTKAFFNCTALESVTFSDSSNLETIGSSTFEGCDALTSITIPDSVTSIGTKAFFNCTALEFVTFSDSSNLETIGSNTFEGCDALTSITIPDSVTSIKSAAFYNCTALKSVTFSNNSKLETIKDATFNGCTALESITIPSSVSGNLMGGTFFNCTALKTVIFSKGSNLTKIISSAFENCKALTSITIPDKVTSIGTKAFFNCTALESVTFSDSSNLETIGSSTFEGCDALTSITIPDSVTSIGTKAFFNCTALKSVTFSETSMLKTIGESAFEGCDALTSITIPDSVTSIKLAAFFNCTSLESVTFSDSSNLETIGNNAFDNCRALTSITIPDSVISIKDSAFDHCIKLSDITLPANITTIGKGVFIGAGLTNLTIKAISPPSISSFKTLGASISSIKVPNGSVVAYKNATGWSTYEKIISAY